jgi:hypothetical protein
MITDQDIAIAEKMTPNPNDQHGVGFVLDEPTQEPYPNGYWKSQTVSGLACGLGFYCHKCHLLYVKGAPDVIWHCGGATAWTENAHVLTHRIGSFVRYPTQTEKWKAAMAVVNDELKNIEVEKASRVDMLAPEPSWFEKAVTFFRSLARA